MKDRRHEVLARLLLDYSVKLKAGEILYLEIKGKDTLELGKEVIRQAARKGATVFWYYNDESLLRHWVANATDHQFKTQADLHLELMRRADAYIGLRGSDNPFDLADIDAKQLDKQKTLFYKPVHLEERVKRTKWVVLRYPSPSMAQQARMSTQAFEDFFFDVCTLDYSKMNRAMQPLKKLMESTDRVRLVGPGTELTFSIKGLPAVICAGKLNIPDGEIFTAPVKNSVNGVIQYNAQTIYQGVVHDNIRLQFKDG